MMADQETQRDPFRTDRMVVKYTNEYVELYDITMRNAVAAALNPELLKERSVGAIVYLPDAKKWLVQLYYDATKDPKSPVYMGDAVPLGGSGG